MLDRREFSKIEVLRIWNVPKIPPGGIYWKAIGRHEPALPAAVFEPYFWSMVITSSAGRHMRDRHHHISQPQKNA